ncbi:hypothetical protein L6452_35596 [Arctium lappa]|uniref:Uncharacterized protein n=1 Tax=Arctium lappa TaxID=4217 RepID=A0ACB8Y6W7_ARCLA|nr:hypothetical protein L6452_35596 [Arctium lappa]
MLFSCKIGCAGISIDHCRTWLWSWFPGLILGSSCLSGPPFRISYKLETPFNIMPKFVAVGAPPIISLFVSPRSSFLLEDCVYALPDGRERYLPVAWNADVLSLFDIESNLPLFDVAIGCSRTKELHIDGMLLSSEEGARIRWIENQINSLKSIPEFVVDLKKIDSRIVKLIAESSSSRFEENR